MNCGPDNMSRVFVAHGRDLLQYLSERQPNQETDMQALFLAFALDTMAEIAFGIHLSE